MSSLMILLAELNSLNPLNPSVPIGKTTGLLFKDVLVIIATGLILTLILILWARFSARKRKQRHRHHHHNREASPSVPSSDTLEEGDEEGELRPGRRRRRRRRRRRDHRSRNPTLAETGGLPPTKSEGPSAPSL